MLHDSFPGSILSCARTWTLLTQIDAMEAERVRSEGCPHCGSCLDSATYPRKPHGLAVSLRDGVLRFSFCCRDCRRRQTPPSVRFFGRRFRVAPVFLAACVVVLEGSTPLAAASRMSGVPVTTLRRWSSWSAAFGAGCGVRGCCGALSGCARGPAGPDFARSAMAGAQSAEDRPFTIIRG